VLFSKKWFSKLSFRSYEQSNLRSKAISSLEASLNHSFKRSFFTKPSINPTLVHKPAMTFLPKEKNKTSIWTFFPRTLFRHYIPKHNNDSEKKRIRRVMNSPEKSKKMTECVEKIKEEKALQKAPSLAVSTRNLMSAEENPVHAQVQFVLL
jgi:hypothetical protein